MTTFPVVRPAAYLPSGPAVGLLRMPRGGFDVHVDSVNGSDDNDGATPATALATLGAIELVEGMRIGLARGSVWREQIEGNQVSGVTVGAYGSGKMPVLDGADVLDGTWTQPDADGLPNVWVQTVSHSVSATNLLSLWKDGERMFWVSSTSALDDPPTIEGAPGYYHVAAASGTSADFYIYSEADPNQDGAVYEASVRDYGIRTGTGWTVRGIRTRRQGHNNGSLILESGSVGEDCLGEDGVKHNIFLGPNSIARRCTAWKSDWPSRDGFTAFVGYADDGSGARVEFEDCAVLLEDEKADWAIANAGNYLTGIYAHTAGGEGQNWAEVVVRRCSVRGANAAIEANNADAFTDEQNYVLGARWGIISQAGAWTSVDPWVAEEGGRIVLRGLGAYSGTATIEGARIYAERGHNHGLVYMPTSQPWSLTRSIIFRDGTGADGWAMLIANSDNGADGDITGCILHTIGGTGGSSEPYGAGTVENNVYYNAAIQVRGSGGTHYPEWSQYEAGETIRDRNSVNADPLVADPANGDFSLDPASPAIALGAGLERLDVAYTPIPTHEELEAL